MIKQEPRLIKKKKQQEEKEGDFILPLLTKHYSL